MSKLNQLLWAANIEILHGLLTPSVNPHSDKTVTIKGRKGSIPGTLRRPSDAEMDNYFKKAGILAGFTTYDKKHTHWCGIFQTYLLNQVGVACHWAREIVDDSGGRDLAIAKGTDAQKGLQIGDIVRVHHQEHHFMVIDPVETGFVRSFEGNAGGLKNRLLAANWMANMRHNVVQQIYLRYRVIS